MDKIIIVKNDLCSKGFIFDKTNQSVPIKVFSTQMEDDNGNRVIASQDIGIAKLISVKDDEVSFELVLNKPLKISINGILVEVDEKELTVKPKELVTIRRIFDSGPPNTIKVQYFYVIKIAKDKPTELVTNMSNEQTKNYIKNLKSSQVDNFKFLSDTGLKVTLNLGEDFILHFDSIQERTNYLSEIFENWSQPDNEVLEELKKDKEID